MFFWNSLTGIADSARQSRHRAHADTAATRLLYSPTSGGPKDKPAQQKVERKQKHLTDRCGQHGPNFLLCLRMGWVSENRYGRLAEQNAQNCLFTLSTVGRKTNQPNEMCTLIVNVIS